MQFGLFQPVHKRRKNCKAKFLTIHITLIEAHGPRLILITTGPCAAGLEDVFSVNSGSYNYGHYHSCATQKCYVKCIHMALKYFFQSYFERLLEKRKWQLKIWCKGLSLLWKCWQEWLAGLGRAGVHRCAMCGLELLWRPPPRSHQMIPASQQPGSSSQNSRAIRPVTGSFRGRNNDSQLVPQID